MGAGTQEHTPASYDNTITIAAIDQLRPLKPYFCKGAHIYLAGCNVGEGEAGRALIDKMAADLGVEVSAGLGDNVSGLFNTGGSAYAYPP